MSANDGQGPIDKYVRLRADPAKVRVSIRRLDDDDGWWRVIVAPIDGEEPRAFAVASGPRKALVSALRTASDLKMPGIDIDMQWAYPHPQRQP